MVGLITAACLLRPDKKLAGVEAKLVKKKFEEKSSAGSAVGKDASLIEMVGGLGPELDELIDIGLKATRG